LHRAQFFIFLISIPAAPFLSVTDTQVGGGIVVAYDADVWCARWYMAVTWAKMRGRLNYIELRVVTQRIYKRIGRGRVAGGWIKGRWGTSVCGGVEFIVRPFGYVWFWKIVTAKNYEPTHARTFWHVRVDHIYLPHVFSVSFYISLPLVFPISFSLSDSTAVAAFPKKYVARGNDVV